MTRDNILDKILAVKRHEVERAKSARPLADLELACQEVSPPRGFATRLRRDREAGDPLRVIAEIKRASPSAGAIRAGADPREVAREYRDDGAAAISVLTDERFFDGHLSFLDQVRETVDLPLLRKDFVIDPYQVVEARAAGADAVLLIVAALDQSMLVALMAEARRLGMDALVEVHSEDEADRALAATADIIGVNHRDLATFTIDMTLSTRLRARIPADTVMVGESGIASADDVRMLGDAGVDAILVGERLMRAASPGVALRELLAGQGA
ncbi:MAG: indole-3-glycerol phosphate synthase TrpC [Proteobacteria bacterium]|nr:indole-3-glycerol phosphate synthase TrpC [Pseudomonadota bacterium]